MDGELMPRILAILFLSGILSAQILAPIMGGKKQCCTFYVSQSGGSDSNPGTLASPWQTIAKVNARTLLAGQSVGFKRGDTWAETLTPGQSGTAGAPIAFAAYGAGALPIIRTAGSNSISVNTAYLTFNSVESDAQNASFDNVLLGSSASNVTFTNCSFSNIKSTAFEAQGQMASLTVNNGAFSGVAALAVFYGNYTGASVLGGSFTGLTNTRSLLRTAGGTTSFAVSGMTIISTGYPGTSFIQAAGSDTLTFTGNTITLSTNPGSFITTTSGKTGAITLTGNTITIPQCDTSPCIGIQAGTFGVDIESNSLTVTSTSQAQHIISTINQATPIIENNTVEHYGTQAAISVSSTGTACGVAVVTGNTVKAHNNGALWGIIVGSDNDPGAGTGRNTLDGSILSNNVVYGPIYYNGQNNQGMHGVFCSYQANCVMSYNSVYGSGYGMLVKSYGQTWTSGGILYNFVKDSDNFQPFGAIETKGVSGIRIYNNTVLFTTAGGVSNTNNMGKTSTNTAGQLSNSIDSKNNLFVAVDADMFWWLDTSVSDQFDYNGYFLSGTSPHGAGQWFVVLDRAGWTNKAAWQALGYDAHAIWTDPLINSDGTLQGGSPAIGAGVYIAGVSTANPPNIGAR